MPAAEKRTISLPEEQAAYVDAKVTAGEYASVSEVVRAGLRALKEQDAAVERWLHLQAAPTYDAMRRNPERAVSGESVGSALEARHQARLKAGR